MIGQASRRGVSLIEMSSVIVISAIIASSTATVLRNAYLVHRDALQWVTKLHSLDRLRDRFTRDVQWAQNATVTDRIELEFAGDARVVYRLENQSLHREKTVRGDIVARDRWNFAQPIRLQTDIDRSGIVPLVSLAVAIDQSTTQTDKWLFRARLAAWNDTFAKSGGSYE